MKTLGTKLLSLLVSSETITCLLYVIQEFPWSYNLDPKIGQTPACSGGFAHNMALLKGDGGSDVL